jgi:pimeloyl-ACP methyl ester carboxylesterase
MSACEHLDVPLAGGRHLTVRRTPGRGRPAVLLHGLLDDAAGWRQVMERSSHPCLAIDLPGFGGSSLPLRAHVDAYAGDVAQALERLDVAHATVVGHSLGGAVAAALVERSGAVDALALLAPAGFGPLRLAELASLPGVRDALQAALPLGLANPLVVTAAYSTFVAHAEGVLRAFPHARVEVWDGMGHHPQRERPEALDRFLTTALWRSRTRASATSAVAAA